MTSVLCAIHQPNFFPWLGFFDKIRRADVFVFLDDVQYPRSGSGGMGSWVNRVRINVQGRAQWIGAPLRRTSLDTPIRSVQIDDRQLWRAKLLRSLDASYRRAPGWPHHHALLEQLVMEPEVSLAEFNMKAVIAIAGRLSLKCRFVRQSELSVEGAGTNLLVELVRAVGASAYLAGGGAGGYQDDRLFAARGIELVFQGFEPRPYGEPSRFIPGLSVIDFLMRAPDGRLE